jgi:F0F1-type ATP synthase epsilon subunit
MLFVAISGGFMEVKPKSRVSILVESGLLVDEIDENAANQVREKTEELLKEFAAGKKQLSDQEFAGAAAQLGKALAQLKVIRRKKRK